MNILDWCGRGLLGEHSIPRPLDALQSFSFWNLLEESYFFNHVFGIQLFWSFALIHHLQFPSCNTRSNIEIAFRLTSVTPYARWRTTTISCQNTHVSSSSYRWYVCEMWTKAGTHITKLDTMGKMKRKVPCWSMVSDMSFTWFRFGGTFLSLEVMFICLISPIICLAYTVQLTKMAVFHAQCVSYSRTSCIGEPFQFGQI